MANFSTAGTMYASAYFYATKRDKNYFHGHCLKPHPKRSDLGSGAMYKKAEAANSTYVGNQAMRRKSAEEGKSKKKDDAKKTKRIDKLDVVDIIRNENLGTDDELLAYADKRRVENGDRELCSFVVKLGEKGRADLLKDATKLRQSHDNVKLKKMSRMEVLKNASSSECTCEQTQDLWLAMAFDVLLKNNIDRREFGTAIYNALKEGRRKHRNVMLIGERNCAKTFLLSPLPEIYTRTFHTPPGSAFGWIGADGAQVIYLNDYRWINKHSYFQTL